MNVELLSELKNNAKQFTNLESAYLEYINYKRDYVHKVPVANQYLTRTEIWGGSSVISELPIHWTIRSITRS